MVDISAVADDSSSEPSGLAAYLHTTDERLNEMWDYLRWKDTTSARNLQAFENYLEGSYRSIKTRAAACRGLQPTVIKTVDQAVAQFNKTKIASRVWRKLIEKAAKQKSRDTASFELAAADEDTFAQRQYALIASIETLRTLLTTAAQLLREESKGGSGGERRKRLTMNEPDRKYHHLAWRAVS